MQVLYFLVTIIPSEKSFLIFHSLSLLTWGPSLAFCFPNFPATHYETIFFYLQHVFLGAYLEESALGIRRCVGLASRVCGSQ